MTSPSSPCVRNCCLDHQDVCLGCGRTLDEILAWHDASDVRKTQILNNCQKRQQLRPKRYR
ncbi:DUF1289 domain-containing protein [Shewanella dokdonensis]|uniref:DUF1289 domain-containing protein n=1 Tax=Shewanella dokdonensis TaxID=712036 RepID=A0ABX8DJM0_9GAMM|nr:DUF1289 domain-containing protein [Shewanella dokdonensis]